MAVQIVRSYYYHTYSFKLILFLIIFYCFEFIYYDNKDHDHDDNKGIIVIVILALIVLSFIITSFVLGLKRVRKIKGNIPKYLILFLLAFICPPLCIYIIKDDLKPDSWFQTIVTVLTCNYCCTLCDPNTAINCILSTCGYIPGIVFISIN